MREPDLRARQRLATRRRAAELSLHAGTVALLVLTSALHANRHGYSWVQTTRVSWLLAYFVDEADLRRAEAEALHHLDWPRFDRINDAIAIQRRDLRTLTA